MNKEEFLKLSFAERLKFISSNDVKQETQNILPAKDPEEMENLKKQVLKTLVIKDLKTECKEPQNKHENESQINNLRKRIEANRKEIARIEVSIKNRRKNTATFIAQSAVKIDWYTNKYSTYRPNTGIEKINEIRYLCS